MAAYLIASYDIADPEAFAKYNPGSMSVIMETLAKHGGEVLSAGPDGVWLAGERNVTIVISFPTVEAAKAWESDSDYAPAKKIRHASTTNRFEVIVPEFVMPTG